MSISTVPQVEASRKSKGTTFQLIKRLAYRHNDDYGYAFPSLEDLADYLRVSIRTVQRHIVKLEQMGELIVERVHGRGLNNRYYLAVIGIFPKPGQKHDRWSRLKDRLNRAFAGKHDNLSAPKLDVNAVMQTAQVPAIDAQSMPRCAGYPSKGQKPRYCDHHRRTHFPT